MSSSTAAEPPVSDTCSLKRSTTSSGADATIWPSAGMISSSSAWAEARAPGVRAARTTTVAPASRRRTARIAGLRSAPPGEGHGTQAEPAEPGDEAGDGKSVRAAVVTAVVASII